MHRPCLRRRFAQEVLQSWTAFFQQPPDLVPVGVRLRPLLRYRFESPSLRFRVLGDGVCHPVQDLRHLLVPVVEHRLDARRLELLQAVFPPGFPALAFHQAERLAPASSVFPFPCPFPCRHALLDLPDHDVTVAVSDAEHRPVTDELADEPAFPFLVVVAFQIHFREQHPAGFADRPVQVHQPRGPVPGARPALVLRPYPQGFTACRARGFDQLIPVRRNDRPRPRSRVQRHHPTMQPVRLGLPADPFRGLLVDGLASLLVHPVEASPWIFRSLPRHRSGQLDCQLVVQRYFARRGLRDPGSRQDRERRLPRVCRDVLHLLFQLQTLLFPECGVQPGVRAVLLLRVRLAPALRRRQPLQAYAAFGVQCRKRVRPHRFECPPDLVLPLYVLGGAVQYLAERLVRCPFLRFHPTAMLFQHPAYDARPRPPALAGAAGPFFELGLRFQRFHPSRHSDHPPRVRITRRSLGHDDMRARDARTLLAWPPDRCGSAP